MRNFGIEIECIRPHGLDYQATRQSVANRICTAGYQAVVAQYHGSNYAVWQIETDGSVRASSDRRGCEMECVSPILRGEDGVQELLAVGNLLSALGCYTNISTGLHVHMDVADLSSQEVLALTLRYRGLQRQINTVLPSYRVGNRYARPLSSDQVAFAPTTQASQLQRRAGRFCSMNFAHLRTRRTIEFRQGGLDPQARTVSATDMVAWVQFLNDFINETVRLVRAGEFHRIESAATVADAAAVATAPAGTVARRPLRGNAARIYAVLAAQVGQRLQIEELGQQAGLQYQQTYDAVIRLRAAGYAVRIHNVHDRRGSPRIWFWIDSLDAVQASTVTTSQRTRYNLGQLKDGVRAEVQAWLDNKVATRTATN